MNERYSFSSWAFCEHLPDGSYKFLTPDMENVELLQRAGELVRRANAYDQLKAENAEAVELLRAVLKTADFPAHGCEDLGTVEATIRAFLDKVGTP